MSRSRRMRMMKRAGREKEWVEKEWLEKGKN
jgi:hypothetical protein